MPARHRLLRPLSSLLLVPLSLLPGAFPVLAAAPPPEPAVPAPGLSRLDPAVARQLEELRGGIAQLEETGADDQRLGRAWGDLAGLRLIYDMQEEAAAAYRRAAELDPAEPRWPYLLAFLQASLGETEAARRGFHRVLELSPGHVPALIRLGELELERGEVAAARQAYQQALRADRSSPAALYGLGRAAAMAGDDAEAARLLERTAAAQPDGSLADYALAQAYRRLGRLEDARRALERYRQAPVGFADPWLDDLGQVSARALLDQVVGLAGDRQGLPDDRFLDHGMALLATRPGAADELRSRLGEGVLTDEARARIEALVGSLQVFEGNEPAALASFRRALELAPDLTEAHDRLANVLMRAGRPADALAELDQVLARRPDDPAVRLRRAAAAMAAGRLETARSDLEQVLAQAPDDAEAHHRLGAVLERLGEPRPAVEHYRQAGRLNTLPERGARAWFEAGRLAAATGDAADALEAYDEARRLDPGLLGIRLGAGGLLLSLGRAADALADFERAVAIDPTSGPAWLGAAISRIALGRHAEALAGLDAALDRLPDSPALLLLAARLAAAAPEAAVRDGVRALAWAERLHALQPGAESTEARALALAELGRFDEAVAWQRQAVEAARQRGAASLAEQMARRLAVLEAGRPWRAGTAAELILLPQSG